TMAEQWLTLPSVIGAYVVMLIAPWNAGPVHPIAMVSSIASSGFWLPSAALAGLVAAALLALWNHPRRRMFLFCAIWLGVSILPMLNLRAFSPLALVEDRYLYLGSVAWCIASAELLGWLCVSIAPTAAPLFATAGLIAVAYAVLLFNAEGYW